MKCTNKKYPSLLERGWGCGLTGPSFVFDLSKDGLHQVRNQKAHYCTDSCQYYGTDDIRQVDLQDQYQQGAANGACTRIIDQHFPLEE